MVKWIRMTYNIGEKRWRLWTKKNGKGFYSPLP